MRGKESDGGQRKMIGRITPAYAGKREEFIMNKINVEGSPPPMRGKDTAETIDFSFGGITPAYAGKS